MCAGNFWENSVRRREFVGACAAAALAGAAAGPSTMARTASVASESEGVPFSLSVMLWTIYRDLPFEQRLEKVAEAGYHAVELVGEFKNWKKQDFANARRKKRELRIEIAAENNIELLIENIDPEENPKYFLTLSAEGFEIVRSVGNPHVKFLYDFFHEQIAAGNLIAKLEKNIDLVGLVHVADVPGRHHPGTGEINYSNIFRKLAELRYSRYVAMEFNPLGDPVKELREARELAIASARSACAARSFESRRPYESA